MTKYHPDSRFLTDYATGNLSIAQALCVSVHMHYCQACKHKVNELANVGSTLFMQIEPVSVSNDCFSKLMAEVDSLGQENSVTENEPMQSSDSDPLVPVLPVAIDKIAAGDLNNLKWHRLGKSFSYSRLDAGENRETSLVHIKAGGSIPHHSHRGDEITVILKGSFSYQEDHYHRGDFIVRSRGEKHRPVASQDEDCLCLVTLDAPVCMSNPLYRMLQPLLRLQSP
ncbi:MAG: ChrR family anti-sigma-E factor [Pseudohongiellaceae bacterium]